MLSSPWFLLMFTCLASFFKKEGTFPRTSNIKIGKIEPPYDFIIVGAGSAGSVVANRLSEVKQWKVLLLESGGLEDEVSDTPLLALDLWNTQKDWNYTTTKQKYLCKGEKNEFCPLPRGHVLGGSSSLNFMQYVRGNKYDFDNWRNLGNSGWGYDDVLPYFLKSEDIQIEELKSSKYHSTGGPLTVTRSPFSTSFLDIAIKAVKELGYEKRDYNGEIQTGIDTSQVTMRNGARCSTAKAFLEPLKDRANVHIVTGVRVTEVILEVKEGVKKAVGVKYKKDGKFFSVNINKEVILSAGSINTPKLLMLSGIGKKEHLEKLNIPMKKDLSVGDNLQDHAVLFMSFKINETISISRADYEQLDAILNYTKGKGILTSPTGIEAIGHLNLDDNPKKSLPDIQYFFSSYPFKNETGITITATKLRPLSVGTLRLKSRDPDDPPIINPNFLYEKKDMDDFIRSCTLVFKMVSTKALSRFSPILLEPEQYCPNQSSNEALCKCLIRYNAVSMYHPVGTAKMGKDPLTSVVTPRLLVHGIENLRIVDGSIMPNITSGNTNAPIIMIGERASDFVKQDWLKKI